MSQNKIEKLYEQHCNCNLYPLHFDSFVENYKQNKDYMRKLRRSRWIKAHPKKVKMEKTIETPDRLFCRECEEWKDKESFYKSSGNKYKRETICKTCKLIRARKGR